MNISELLKYATPAPEPLTSGELALISFRPDLGSQQEFIVGAAILVAGEGRPRFKWLPSLGKLSLLYGDSISSNEMMNLFKDSERFIGSTHRISLRQTDTGTPNLKLNWCGRIPFDDVDAELLAILKRQSGSLWTEKESRKDPMNDDWAYSQMIQALSGMALPRDIFIPGRSVVLNGKSMLVGLDNSLSFGNIVSARYSQFQTVERHVFRAIQQVVTAHRLSARATLPALFVILPEKGSVLEPFLTKKSTDLLGEIEQMGVVQFCDPQPEALARQIEAWAEV